MVSSCNKPGINCNVATNLWLTSNLWKRWLAITTIDETTALWVGITNQRNLWWITTVHGGHGGGLRWLMRINASALRWLTGWLILGVVVVGPTKASIGYPPALATASRASSTTRHYLPQHCLSSTTIVITYDWPLNCCLLKASSMGHGWRAEVDYQPLTMEDLARYGRSRSPSEVGCTPWSLVVTAIHGFILETAAAHVASPWGPGRWRWEGEGDDTDTSDTWNPAVEHTHNSQQLTSD